MSSFRDFLFDRGRSERYALALAMIGVRMGERLLMVGDDAPLASQLAAKVGLTGHVPSSWHRRPPPSGSPPPPPRPGC